MAKKTVGDSSAVYLEMAKRWALPQTLMGGTLAMRAAGDTYLPREEKENPIAYQCRLDRSILYEGFADTVAKLAAKPFGDKIKVQNGDVPEALSQLLIDADLEGASLEAVMEEWFDDAILHGKSHLVVDFPTVKDLGRTRTRADDLAEGVRPYLTIASAANVIGWKSEPGAIGPRLTEVRIREMVSFPDPADPYNEVETEVIKVWTRFEWSRHKKAADGSYSRYEGAPHTFGRIPMVTIYTNRKGFMTAVPPLEGLAWLNLAHWQSQSDHRNILRFIRLGILFAAGFTEEEIEKGVVVGPNRLVSSTKTDAKLTYVETTGKATEAGKDDLDHLEAQMEVMGLQPLVERGSAKTATGHAMDEARTHSAMKQWIRNLQDGLLEAMSMAGEWIGVKLPKGILFKLFTDYTVQLSGSSDMDVLLKLCAAKKLQTKTLLEEAKRRGVISEFVDTDAEVKAEEKAKQEEEAKAKAEADAKAKLDASQMKKVEENPTGVPAKPAG